MAGSKDCRLLLHPTEKTFDLFPVAILSSSANVDALRLWGNEVRFVTAAYGIDTYIICTVYEFIFKRYIPVI